MAPSPSKRRKLSPTAPNSRSVPVTPNPAQVARDGAQTMNSRPSFASPTKASIARHNPQLLVRPTSTGPGDERSAGAENVPPEERSKETLFVTPTKVHSMDANVVPPQTHGANLDGVDRTPRPDGGATTPGKPTLGRETRSSAGGLGAAPRRRSRTPGKEMPRAGALVGGSVNSTKRKEIEQPSTTEKAVTPILFRSGGLRRSPVAPQGVEAAQALQAQEPPEPELPLTPTERGLTDPVVTTPATGIHNTPSKRPKRPRGAKAKPSPLKLQAEAGTEKEALEESESERPEKRRKASEYASRHLVPIDPHAEKKKLRDQILQEVQGLQADIALAEKENERLRRHYSSSKAHAEPPLSDEILGLLVRTTAEVNPKPQPPKRTSIFKSIGSFLPFAPRPRPPPVTPPKETLSPSHLPIKVEDQLPYLKLFTPLTYTSTITLLPPTPPPSGDKTISPTILQNHAINILAPSGLFAARLNVIVDTSRFSVSSLTIPSLDPAAEDELGRWARERASGKSILGRDVSAICWAMARWYEVATRRAKFWYEIERRFGNEEGRRKSNARIKAIAANLRKRKGNSSVVVEDAGQGDADEEDVDDGAGARKWTRKQLWPQMSRRTMMLGNESVELRIRWDVTFDWTGEAESRISGSARVPASCKFAYHSQTPFPLIF